MGIRVASLVVFSLIASPAFGQEATAEPSREGAAYLGDPVLTLDGAPTSEDIRYESRVLGAFRAQQGEQGPLDGRWHVSKADGSVLYTLQITDPGAGAARMEGAWSNPRTKDADGFIDSIASDQQDIVLSFHEKEGGPPTEVRLHPNGSGGFAGEAIKAGARTGVVANRAQGVETAALAVPAWSPAPPPKASVKKSSKKKSKASSRSKSKAKKTSKKKRR